MLKVAIKIVCSDRSMLAKPWHIRGSQGTCVIEAEKESKTPTHLHLTYINPLKYACFGPLYIVGRSCNDKQDSLLW